MKTFNQAPLPFMGQKRKFLKQLLPYLERFTNKTTFVDLFGGSGLLSRFIKDKFPDAKVVYNDYDNYRERIQAIPATNAILASIRTILKDHPKDKRISSENKALILERIKQEKGFVDYITISSSLLFSMNYATSFESLAKESFYNCVRQSDYNADGYLDGLDIVCCDYKELYNRYKDVPGVVFLVDPPYLSTDVGTYKNYWKLGDYLDVLNVLQFSTYFYFTSNKSNIIELCSWMSANSNYQNPFDSANVNTMHQQVNYSSSYTDIMVFKEKKHK